MNAQNRLMNAVMSLATATVVVLAAPSAQACKDCPFPSKIADGRWLMPNKMLQIEIDELDGPDHRTDEIHVILRDARSGDIVAKGISIQRTGRRTVTVDLTDSEGRQIKGFVHYLGAGKHKIEAKFTCKECAIETMLN